MTGALSTLELSQMQSDFDGLYNDTCQIGTPTEAADSAGEMIRSYTYASAISCGIEMTGGKERARADGTRTVIDATLRVPVDTTITVEYRVYVTKRHGSTLDTAITFEVVGYPQQGPSGLVVELQAVD